MVLKWHEIEQRQLDTERFSKKYSLGSENILNNMENFPLFLLLLSKWINLST